MLQLFLAGRGNRNCNALRSQCFIVLFKTHDNSFCTDLIIFIVALFASLAPLGHPAESTGALRRSYGGVVIAIRDGADTCLAKGEALAISSGT